MKQVEQVEVEVQDEVQPKVEISFKLDDLMKEHKTKSNVIRFLSSKNYTRSQISKFMGIRYQHVRNVLTQPLKQKVQ